MLTRGHLPIWGLMAGQDLTVAVTLCCPLELSVRGVFFGEGPDGWSVLVNRYLHLSIINLAYL